MKTLILATTAAIALSGAAFAEGDGSRYTGETSHGDAALVFAHFAQDQQPGEGPAVLIPGDIGATLSTSNSDLASLAAAKLSNGERGDN